MKTKLSRYLLLALLGFSILIQSCNRPQVTPTPDIDQIVAQTQTAIAINQMLTASISDATPTVQVNTPTSEIQAPTPESATPECTNMAEFVGETVPDNSSFLPGVPFTKNWIIRNSGTCTWNKEYSLVFDSGDRMSGKDPIWLTKEIHPGEQLEISVALISPQEPGEYQGFWKLQNQSGIKFGLGDNAEVAFWVKILVTETESPLNLGPPNGEITFAEGDVPFYIGADEHISYVIKDGQLIMTAFDSSGDQWRIAQLGYLEDFYLETQYTTGDACTGKDSYGLIVRAPDQPDSIVDSGYIFVASCDGHYRVYLMNNGNYSSIVNWTREASINTGTNQTNSIGIRALGTKFQMYINNVPVTEFEDHTHQSGYFGLTIRSDSTQNFKVSVQKISYWLID